VKLSISQGRSGGAGQEKERGGGGNNEKKKESDVDHVAEKKISDHAVAKHGARMNGGKNWETEVVGVSPDAEMTSNK